MNTTGRSGWSSWSLSILLHVLVVFAAAGFWFWKRHSPPAGEQRLAIEASVVTSQPATPVSEPAYEPPVEAPAEPPPEPALPQPDPVQEAAEQEKREAEAARVAQAERVAEQRRVAEARLAAQRKAEQAAKEKVERDKKEREKAERDKADREKLEQERREKLEQERKERERVQVEQARQQRESDLNAQIAAEERAAAARAGAAGRQYIAQIAARIDSNWKRPPEATAGTQCEIRVTQLPTGVVTAVQVVRCNRDEIVRRSIEDAVNRASPLPLPSDPALFDRNLTITFRRDN